MYIFLFASCTVGRFIPEGELFLKDVTVTSDNPRIVKKLLLEDYVVQEPNSRWLGMKIPLATYCLSGVDTTNWATRFFRRIGQAPVIYDSNKAQRTLNDILQVLNNEGYLKAAIAQHNDTTENKISVNYEVTTGPTYFIRNIKREIADSALNAIINNADTANSLLHQGMQYNSSVLNNERNRITSTLRNMGYYHFNKDYIKYTADTCKGSTMIDLAMAVKLYKANRNATPAEHIQYTIGNVNYITDPQLHLRSNILPSNTLFKEGELFREEAEQLTYRYLNRLQAISYSNIRINERENSNLLDVDITTNHAKVKSMSFDIEGTNSAGDFGAAASIGFNHKNIFHGSEIFAIKLRGAYEAITGLEGYEGSSYIEMGGETSLTFPGFLLPFISKQFGATHNATSEISVQYNFQNRPEFNRRVLSAAWRYRWSGINMKEQHRFDLLEISYVRMPWISQTFKEQYLDSLGKTNAILKYNYEDQLITKLGYTYAYNSLGNAVTSTYGKNAHTFKFNIETSGNLLSLITPSLNTNYNSNGQRTIFGIAYAQYVKGDFDITKSIRIDRNNSIAFHSSIGIAYPYGNSDILPFEKRYFAGGANSVRGWNVRSLGPGRYNNADQGINFINQSGDIKLNFSAEYRAMLFWKFSGAIFVDAGNIWTIKSYADQPGGQFRYDTFLQELAVAYGLGLRLNLDFFILRFDTGMKAIDPAYSGNAHYPFLHPSLKNDLTFHFAVGLPF